MTDVQVRYAQHLEQARHNLAQEQETARANRVNEVETNRSNLARESETNRSNLAREAETNRHNLVIENHSAQSLAETKRSNLANERLSAERNRITESGNYLNYKAQIARVQAQDRATAAQRAYNSALVGLKQQELDVSSRNATTNERNAATNERKQSSDAALGWANVGTNSILGKAGVAGLVGVAASKSLKKSGGVSSNVKQLDKLLTSISASRDISTFDPFMLITVPGIDINLRTPATERKEILQ